MRKQLVVLKRVDNNENDLSPPRRMIEEREDNDIQEEEEKERVLERARPVGKIISSFGKSRLQKSHYNAFDFHGHRYNLEDPVLINSGRGERPYVAIIKDIYHQNNDPRLMVTGQWFYRPEDAVKKGGGRWQTNHYRELYYSFHRDDIPAESVMHKCVVLFIPLTKQIPDRKQHRGFIVQKIYDTKHRRLFKLTDKDYEDDKQQEIDVLVNKTLARIGVLHDVEALD